MEGEFFGFVGVFWVGEVDGVAGVGSAVGAEDDVVLVGEDVYYFAFSFVAPLSSDY